ncbi:MAG TPA: glycosyltransferase [Tepidisphaeraceae bacterium]
MNPNVCWCGNAELQEWSAEYRLCPACQTLISKVTPAQDDPHVKNDEADFYGKEYWFKHQEQDLGFSNIQTRARTDLSERCLHWLKTVLKYKLPPAEVLELGGAHGGFVAMLQRAGFATRGLELSPWVVQYAKETFGIEMLLGPIEDQPIAAGSLDVIAMMDVMEHLPDPVGTMRRCLELLKDDGVLVIQTPGYREGRAYAQIIAEKDRFQEQLKSIQHLYLFSRSSARELFRRLGAEHVADEPAMFYHYDMFLIVGKRPLVTHAPQEVEAALQRSPDARFMQALLDAGEQINALQGRLTESEQDRENRLASIAQLQQWLQESETDRANRLAVIEQQGRQAEVVDGQLRELAAQAAGLRGELDALRGLRLQLADALKQRGSLQAQLEEREKMRALEAEKSAELAEELKQAGAKEAGLRQRFEEASASAEQLRGDNAQLNKVALRQNRDLALLNTRMAAAQTAANAVRHSPMYKVFRKLGRWNWLEPVFETAFPNGNGSVAKALPKKKTVVAVDMTPVLPGGDNGGAKLVAIGAIRQLARLVPDWDFILLTSGKSHDELEYLDAANVRRVCVIHQGDRAQAKPKFTERWKLKVGQKLVKVLPPPIFDRLRRIDASMQYTLKRTTLMREIGADLLFSVFTAPNFYDPPVPVVSVVYDLQYLYYPQFFPANELYYRDKHFREAVRVAGKVCCISDFVRGTVLENTGLPPERVKTVHIRLYKRIAHPTPQRLEEEMKKRGLKAGRYLFFPANFWPHKNHQMLLTAYRMYRQKHPDSDLKLVFTGAPDERMKFLRDQAVAQMGLADHVLFCGYVKNDEFAAILQGCRAVIFPSLYEGFGMPVLEAMAFGKPVMCSDVTSLPEVAGEAALQFDPRRPADMLAAMERIADDDDLVAEMVKKGERRVKEWGDEERMAREYLAVFREVIGSRGPFTNTVQGLWADGWTQDRVLITYEAGADDRALEIALFAPPMLPQEKVNARLAQDNDGKIETYIIERGREMTIRHAMKPEGGFIELYIEPMFVPAAVMASDDQRSMGCMCRGIAITSPVGSVELMGQAVSVG